MSQHTHKDSNGSQAAPASSRPAEGSANSRPVGSASVAHSGAGPKRAPAEAPAERMRPSRDLRVGASPAMPASEPAKGAYSAVRAASAYAANSTARPAPQRQAPLAAPGAARAPYQAYAAEPRPGAATPSPVPGPLEAGFGIFQGDAPPSVRDGSPTHATRAGRDSHAEPAQRGPSGVAPVQHGLNGVETARGAIAAGSDWDRSITRADTLSDRLAGILAAETELYRDAARIAPKKTDVIVRGKIEELDSLVAVEQAIIMKVGRLEDERERIIADLGAELGSDLTVAPLSKINELLGERNARKLESCQGELVKTLAELKDTNDVNTQLIQNALDYVNFSVNLLADDQAGGLYSQDGDDSPGGSRGGSVFDVKL